MMSVKVEGFLLQDSGLKVVEFHDTLFRDGCSFFLWTGTCNCVYTVVFGLAAVNSQLAGKFTFFSGKCIYIHINASTIHSVFLQPAMLV